MTNEAASAEVTPRSGIVQPTVIVTKHFSSTVTGKKIALTTSIVHLNEDQSIRQVCCREEAEAKVFWPFYRLLVQ